MIEETDLESIIGQMDLITEVRIHNLIKGMYKNNLREGLGRCEWTDGNYYEGRQIDSHF
jgi:hypothetical protein